MTTEFTSNVSTATIVLPILASMAQDMHVHPLLLIIPGCVSCSFAFMLPVATPPNAIAFSTGRLDVRHMMRPGALLNLIGVCLSTFYTLTWAAVVFEISFESVPDWAASPMPTPVPTAAPTH